MVELRAVAAVLPDSFDFDLDGKKQAWRAHFLAKLKALCQQQCRLRVRCGWDPARQMRREVSLPALRPEQMRRGVYFHLGDRAAGEKLKKLDAAAARLAAKQARLRELESVKLPELKLELEASLADFRAEYFRQLLGKQQLAQVIKHRLKRKDSGHKLNEIREGVGESM